MRVLNENIFNIIFLKKVINSLFNKITINIGRIIYKNSININLNILIIVMDICFKLNIRIFKTTIFKFEIS